HAMNMLEELFFHAYYFMLMAAAGAIPLLLIVLTLDLTVGRWLSPAIRSLLWTLVAVRMLIPIALPNTQAVPNLGWAMLEGGSPHETPSHRNSIQFRADSPPVIPRNSVVGATGADLTMPTPLVNISPPPP